MVPGNTTEAASSLRPSFLPEMQLHRPTQLGDVFAHMANGAQLLSGGTDILLQAGQHGSPDHLVWTGGVKSLNSLSIARDSIKVGAAVPLSTLIRSADFRTMAPAVMDGAHVVGSTQLRHQATMVGNICTASPSADTVPGLMVHDAVVEITNELKQSYQVALKDFIKGPGQINLERGALVTAIDLHPIKNNEMSAYQRFTQRNALDLAFACVAVKLAFEDDGQTIQSVKLALGAVGPTVIDASEAADVLIGQTLDVKKLKTVCDAASQLAKPISDHRASRDYRHQLIKVLVGDVINQAADRFGINL